MKLYKYGNPESNIVLIQPVGTHNLNEIPNQVERIKINTKKEMGAALRNVRKEQSGHNEDPSHKVSLLI